MRCFRQVIFLFLTVVVGSVANLPAISAQMIGNRTLGTPTLSLQQQRSGTSSTASPGSSVGSATGLQGPNARYMRGNRSRQDFVGSNRTDQTGFVGSGQAIGVGRVPSATENLKLETSKAGRINRPLPPQPAKGMYYPRLSIEPYGETSSGLPSIGPASPAVMERVAEFSNGQANVTMVGTTAILRGKAASRREADLLAQILSFEPGIDLVKNELVIN